MLNEAYETDIFVSEQIDALRLKVYNYIWNLRKSGETELPHATSGSDGREVPALMVKDADPDTIFRDVLLAFDDELHARGMCIPLKQAQSGVRYVVKLRSYGLEMDDFIYALWNETIAQTFRHEFTHVYDIRRRKEHRSKVRGTGTIEPKLGETDTEQAEREASEAKYINNPLESNALYHELAEPLLRDIRFLNTEPHRDGVELLTPPTQTTFVEWLEFRLKTCSMTVKRFYPMLSEKKKRRTIRRLKAVWDNYWRLLNAAKEVEPE